MIALVAAAGDAVGRFARFGTGACGGAELRELTERDGPIRLGVVSPGGSTGTGSAVTTARDGVRTVAAIGSGIAGLPASGAAALLETHRRGGTAFLDGAPYDLAALVAETAAGTLTVGACAGSHRLFVAEVDGGLLASSHLVLLAAALGSELQVDRALEDFLLGFGFLPDGRTVYAGVRTLGPGRAWAWPASHASAAAGPKSSTAVTLPGEVPVRPPEPEAPDPPSSPGEARRLLHDTFFQVLEDQAGARRRHAVLLGGFDSALVVAGLGRLGHQVDTYTFAFGDPRYEQRSAEEVSSVLGARHHRVRFTPEIIADGMERFAEFFNQPAPQPHYQLHTAHASRIIAGDGHDHLFTGDGCDSAFLGYPTVSLRAHLVERVGLLPRVVRQGLLGLTSSSAVERRIGHVARAARSTLRSLDLPWPARGHLPTQYLDRVALDRLRLGTPPVQEASVDEVRLRLSEGLDDLDPVRLAFHGNGLVGQSVAKVEGAVAVSGAAQLSPYRDPRLGGLVRSLPVELFRPRKSRPGSAGKAILFDMVRERELLPGFVIDLPKQSPSDSPIDRWYAGPLRPVVHRLLDGLPFEHDRRYVEEILSPKWAEEVFRDRISLGHHALQSIGLLCSYAAFTRYAP